MKGTSPIIPWYITNKIQQNGRKISLPMQFTEKCAVLFTDVCSFTKLTDFFSSSGHYGVEGITGILEEYFTIMIDCINQNYGSLIKLGGDSILAIFTGDKETAIGRMQQCGKDMFTSLEKLNKKLNKKYGTIITFRGGGAYGELITNIVGDENHHLDYYFVGSGLEKALEMEESASPETIKYAFKKTQISQDSVSPVIQMNKKEKAKMEKQFVSEKIRQRVIGDIKFKAELKNAAILFINVHNKKGQDSDYINFKDYNDLYCKIQETVYSLDGNINKIDYNEKGYLILITFGVPNIHYDDIERAFVCAYRLSQIPSETIGIRTGITYSNIFAGIFGSPERFEYGIIGNGVNAAARLMSVAKEGEITFSEEILHRIKSRFESEFVEETTVKGFAQPIKIYRLKGELPENWNTLNERYSNRILVTKKQELQDAYKSLLKNETDVIKVYGKTGAGKTFYLFSIIEKLKNDYNHIDLYILEEFNFLSKLDFVMKTVMKRLQLVSLEKDFHKIRAFCDAKNINMDSKLFLERIISFYSGKAKAKTKKVSVSSTTVSLADEKLKNELFLTNLQDILTALLSETEIVVIDNYQWMDILSQKILNNCMPVLIERGVKLILTSDRLNDDLSEQKGSINELSCLNQYRCLSIDINPLNLEETKELVTFELSPSTTFINSKGEQVTKSNWASNISSSAVKMLLKMSNGNPLFLIELTKIIRNNFDYRQDMLTDNYLLELKRNGVIPPTMESIFLRQFEILDNKTRHLLMIASIIGSTFSLNDLLITDKEQLQEDIVNILSILHNQNFIDQKDLNPEIEYIFSNSLMRESIYKTILMSEKKGLHERIAYYYEEKYTDNLFSYIETIANHYNQTDNTEKKIYYCRKAAEKNSQLYCLDESCHYYDLAISYTDDEALKIALEMDKAVIMILQGKISDVENKLRAISPMAKKLKANTDIQEYLLYVKVKLRIYQADYKGVLSETDNYKKEIKNKVYRNSIQSYRLDSLRFLNRYDEFTEQAFQLLKESQRDKDIVASISSLIGQYYLDLADFKNSRIYFRKKLAAAEKINDKIQIRQAYNSIGVTYSREGNRAKAKEFFTKALDIAENMGDRNGLLRIMMNLGILCKNEGNYKEAMDYYYRSLRLTKLTLNKEQEAIILYNIGEAVFHESGKMEKSLEFFNKSLEIALSINDNIQVTFCYDAIGDMLFHLKKYRQAEDTYNKNLQIQQNIGDREGIAHTYGNLGNIAKVKNQFDKAFQFYQKQQQILTEVGDKDGEGRAWFNMAMIDIENGEHESAKEKLLKALKLFEEISAKYYIDITKERIEALTKE